MVVGRPRQDGGRDAKEGIHLLDCASRKVKRKVTVGEKVDQLVQADLLLKC